MKKLIKGALVAAALLVSGGYNGAIAGTFDSILPLLQKGQNAFCKGACNRVSCRFGPVGSTCYIVCEQQLGSVKNCLSAGKISQDGKTQGGSGPTVEDALIAFLRQDESAKQAFCLAQGGFGRLTGPHGVRFSGMLRKLCKGGDPTAIPAEAPAGQ